MGFKDLFKPKWKHSDWKVRKAEVEKITNQVGVNAEFEKNRTLRKFCLK